MIYLSQHVIVLDYFSSQGPYQGTRVIYLGHTMPICESGLNIVASAVDLNGLLSSASRIKEKSTFKKVTAY